MTWISSLLLAKLEARVVLPVNQTDTAKLAKLLCAYKADSYKSLQQSFSVFVLFNLHRQPLRHTCPPLCPHPLCHFERCPWLCLRSFSVSRKH